MKAFLISTTVLSLTSAGYAMSMDDSQPESLGEQAETVIESTGEFFASLWDEADLDRAPYTDDHEWVEAHVRTSDDVDVGEVERVRFDETGTVDAIVVEHGGFLEIGGRETLIESPHFVASLTDDGPVVMLTATYAEFEAMRAFNENEASDYPLSENEPVLDDDTMDDEGNVDTGSPR